MGKVVEKKKKKKGRPSLLDLQKRSLRQQQEQNQQKQNPNSNPYRKPTSNPNPNGRYTRRNPYPDGISAAAPEGADAGDDDDDDDNEEDEDNSSGQRREKKLKFVLRLPSNQQHRTLNSSLNSGSYGSDSNADEENSETLQKKRKFNTLVDGSDPGHAKKGEETKSGSEREEVTGSLLESGPTTPLPDKKLLLFILDRLQKKDTYGVFSEPVDPKELPDYHEIIKHPMDFGTVRKKLDGGAYANLEQFEKDVLLICSNAMQYNAPDTIYYRQARSMLEVAKKDFENLRQDSEDNTPEPRVARRGRPPTKHLKKPPGRPRFDCAGSEDATLATAGDSAIWPVSYDPRKDRSGLSDAFGRKSHNTGAYTSLLSERKSEKNDVFPGMSVKYGKKQFILDENRRNTYKQFHPLAAGHKPSVFTVFDGEPKQLTTVGLQAEYGYARSLACFAANLGPVAWKIACRKIERALPAGVNFGPGWVGENDVTQPWQHAQPQPPPQLQTIPSVRPSPISKVSISTATPDEVESKAEKTSEKYSSNCLPDGIHSMPSFPSAAISSAVPFRTPELITGREEAAAKGLNYDNGSSLQNSSVGAIGPRPPFQIHQSHLIHNSMNGCTGGFGINLAHNMEKLARPGSSTRSFGSEAAVASEMHGTVARSNNFMCPKPSSHSEVDKSGASNIISSGDVLPDSCQESQLVRGVRQHPSSWGLLSVHQKIDPVPPDLNVRFQSQGSPSSSVPVDSPQPDLALQL